jgi:hypothetical protein
LVPALAGGFTPGSTLDFIGTGGNVWAYRTTDTITQIVGSQYFTDGFRRGMRKYDLVSLLDVTTPRATWSYVSALSTVSTGGATVTLFSST